MGFQMDLPAGAALIIGALERAGHEAYAVGGCVRDRLMGRVPQDYDIATSAEPSGVSSALAGLRAAVIPTGLAHGTVTVSVKGGRFEVTTFRVDGKYSDGRRPDSVCFTKSLEEDLKRRDFTINALAYSPKGGLVDLFDGAGDIRRKIIRCVGDARARFGEDYLRIARAYRFAAVLGFELEPSARAAAIELKARLNEVAAERVRVELDKTLLSGNFPMIELFLADCADVLLPELAACRGCVQNNKYHRYDVYDHTMVVLRHTPSSVAVRLAALLHDTGKPLCAKADADGIFHFKGHEARSADIARETMKRLKYDNATADDVVTLTRHHDDGYTPESGSVKRLLLNPFGERLAGLLLDLVEADTLGKSDVAIAEKLLRVRACRETAARVVASGEAYTVKQLAVNGADVMAAVGAGQGRAVGRALAYLLDKVMDEPALNERETLIGLLGGFDATEVAE